MIGIQVGGKDLTATGIYPGTFAMKAARLKPQHPVTVCVCVESVPANIAQVAHILDNHFKTMKPKPVINELEMELFDDSCEESSDSGLENLVGNSSQ